MPTIFPQGTDRQSFDGYVLAAIDDGGVTGTVYEIPCSQCDLNILDNNDYPILIDDATIPAIKVPGVRMGSLTFTGVRKNDHFVSVPASTQYDFLTQAFGPRTNGNLFGWTIALVPYNGDTPIIMNGVWFSTYSESGDFGVRGAASAISFNLNAMVINPDNAVYVSTAPSAPAVSGTVGAGVATMANMSATNGGSTPVVYDQINAYRLMLSNRLQIIPAIINPANRMAAGCIAGPVTGAVGMTQLKGCTNPLPQTTGNYPLNIVLPDPNGSKVWTSALSVSWDSIGQGLAALAVFKGMVAYTLFSTNTGNATNAVWPFVNSYA